MLAPPGRGSGWCAWRHLIERPRAHPVGPVSCKSMAGGVDFFKTKPPSGRGGGRTLAPTGFKILRPFDRPIRVACNKLKHQRNCALRFEGFFPKERHSDPIRADVASAQRKLQMGRRGPPSMHPHLRLLKGFPGGRHRARPQVEATIPDELPEPPAFLNGYALDEWQRVTPELYRLGLLSVLDIMPLAAWCVAAGRWRDASEALAALPESERLVVGDTPQPLLRIVRAAADQMQRLGAPFGSSGPNSRARLTGAVKREPGKFDGLLGGDSE
jgi:P27 family predicted phage terminase small subunit